MAVVLLVLLVLLVSACSPALDWREVRPPGLGLGFAMPCRPDVAERRLQLIGTEVTWKMHACSAEGLTFALAWADVADPQRVGPALQALGAAAQANVHGRIEHQASAQVPGMTPNAQAQRWRLIGRLPDGSALQEEVWVFAHGTQVFQATAVGALLAPQQTKVFFEALRVAP